MTFAAFMMAAGIPARTIMEVLGHSEIGVTMNTYTHVLAQLREDAADAIDSVLGARNAVVGNSFGYSAGSSRGRRGL
jgi:integrase